MSNQDLISDWFHSYSNDVYHFLIYYRGPQDAEDLIQEVFIRAYKNLNTFKRQSSVKTWLISIARNLAIDEARKPNNKYAYTSNAIEHTANMEDAETPDMIFATSETQKSLYNAIHSLKPNYRDVLILKGIKEFTTEEAASILNWSKEKTHSTYYRALKDLKKKQGGKLSEEL